MTGVASLPISVDDTRAYLRGAGWRREGGGSFAELWARVDSSAERIIVPLIVAGSDYEQRLRELTQDLSRAEQRPAEEIAEQISRQFVDVTDLRASDDDVIGDTIPVSAGVELFRAAKNLVIASAATTVRRQAHFRNMPQRAREHAHKVRLGQTRRGSYIIPIISEVRASAPVDVDEYGTPHLIEHVEHEMFDRRVQMNMSRALSVLEELAVSQEGHPTRQQIYEAVGAGLSREMTEAVRRALGTAPVGDLDVSFSWAGAVEPPVGVPAQVEFPHEALQRLDFVSAELTRAQPPRDEVVYGVVTHLDSREGEDGGRVIVEAMVNNQRKLIQMSLTGADYAIAHASHKRARVIAQGRMAGTGRRVVMDVSHFGLDDSMDTVLQSAQ